MNKKVIIVGLMIAMLCTGCTSNENTTVDKKSESVKSEQADKTNEKENKKTESNDNKASTTEKEKDTTETNIPTPATNNSGGGDEVIMQKAMVYYIDDNDTVQKKEVEIEVLNEKTLWQLLKDDGTVAQDTEVLSMSMNKDFKIDLDVNHAFGNQLRSLGTDGEYHVMECVVNSYLDTFVNNSIKITEEGNVLESGHVVYKGYSERMEE